MIKNWKYFHSLFLNKMKQETDTYFIILQIEKKKLLEYKSTIQENLQTEQFTKGLVYDFGQKIEIVSTHSSVF